MVFLVEVVPTSLFQNKKDTEIDLLARHNLGKIILDSLCLIKFDKGWVSIDIK